MNSVPVGFAPSGDVFVVPARPAEKKKRPPVRFDDLGNVILPPGALDPSETTLLARAMVLQGQEARASTDALLNASISTPEELMAFVGGRDDLSTADILQAKTVLRSAADLRKEVTDTAQLARDQQDVLQQTVEDADAAAQQAAAAAAVVADRVATGIDGLTAAAAPVAAIAPIAPVSVPAPIATGVAATPGGPAPGGMPVYAKQVRTKLATKAQGALNVVSDASSTPDQKAGAQIQADIALDGIRAYDNLYAIGFFREVVRSAKSRALTAAEKADMLVVNRAMRAASVMSSSDKFNTVMSGVLAEARTGASQAAAAKQAADSAAVIAAQEAALKKAALDRAAVAAAAAAADAAKAKAEAAAKAKLVADAQAASQAAADAQAKADAAAAADAAKAAKKAAKKARQAAAAKGGMTGSGLDWREIGALAMDKAEAGDQVGALRLLADATGDGLVFPDGKLSKLYMYVRSR